MHTFRVGDKQYRTRRTLHIANEQGETLCGASKTARYQEPLTAPDPGDATCGTCRRIADDLAYAEAQR